MKFHFTFISSVISLSAFVDESPSALVMQTPIFRIKIKLYESAKRNDGNLKQQKKALDIKNNKQKSRARIVIERVKKKKVEPEIKSEARFRVG